MTETNTAMTIRQPQAPAYLPSVSPEAIEQALAIGDMSKMSAEVRVAYYIATCQSAGLNPMTRPFDLIKGDDGAVRPYPNKVAAEQLRKIHRVSNRVSERRMDVENGLYIVTVQACTPDGREDEAQGIVDIAGKKGMALANAMMKCETKAKRRATLSLCGLGYEDSEDVAGHPVRFDYQQGVIHPASPVTLLPPPATSGNAVAEVFGERQAPARTTTQPQQDVDTPTQKQSGALIVQSIIAAWKALGYPMEHVIAWGKAKTASYGLERMEHIPVTDLMKILEEVRSQPRYVPEDWRRALADVGMAIPERDDTAELHKRMANAIVDQTTPADIGLAILADARAWVAEHAAEALTYMEWPTGVTPDATPTV